MTSFKLYDKHYKRLMVLPAVLTVVFLFIIFVFPGVTLGLDFVGGTRMIVNTDQLSEQPVRDLLSNQLNLPEVKVAIVSSPFGDSARIEYAEPKFLSDARIELDKAVAAKNANPEQARTNLLAALALLNVPAQEGSVEDLVLQTSQAINAESEKISTRVRTELISQFDLPASTSFTIEEVSPTFGASFLNNALMVAIVSIVLLIIVVFIFFQEFIPAVAIIEAVLFDILTAVALATLFGFPFTLSMIASLLMLVGYSVDTDILLTTRALKRKDKTIMERCNDTLLTGLTVTATVMGAALVMLVVSYFAQITVIFEIAAIVLFGMIGDIIATWFTNAPILLWYWERKHGKVGGN